jgi:hypothetical protein
MIDDVIHWAQSAIKKEYLAQGTLAGPDASDLPIPQRYWLGVPVYLVAQEGVPTPVWWSRYWAKRTWWDFSRPEQDSLAFLLEVGRDSRASTERARFF